MSLEGGTFEILEAWKSQLSERPSQDRANSARFLLDSLGPENDEDAEAAWEIELARRAADIRSGRVVGTPAEQVFAELREQFP